MKVASGYHWSHQAKGLLRMRWTHWTLWDALYITDGEEDRNGNTEPHCSWDRCLMAYAGFWQMGFLCCIPASWTPLQAGASLPAAPAGSPQELLPPPQGHLNRRHRSIHSAIDSPLLCSLHDFLAESFCWGKVNQHGNKQHQEQQTAAVAVAEAGEGEPGTEEPPVSPQISACLSRDTATNWDMGMNYTFHNKSLKSRSKGFKTRTNSCHHLMPPPSLVWGW